MQPKFFAWLYFISDKNHRHCVDSEIDINIISFFFVLFVAHKADTQTSVNIGLNERTSHYHVRCIGTFSHHIWQNTRAPKISNAYRNEYKWGKNCYRADGPRQFESNKSDSVTQNTQLNMHESPIYSTITLSHIIPFIWVFVLFGILVLLFFVLWIYCRLLWCLNVMRSPFHHWRMRLH